MMYHLSHPKTKISYKLDLYKDGIDFNNSEDISKYINLTINELNSITDDIVRGIEVKKISELTGVDTNYILSRLNKSEKVNTIKVKTIQNIKKDKFVKAEDEIIFNMINNNDYILYYFNNLSYLPDENYKKLANEIVLFYKKFNSFNINDFVVYLEDKKDLINLINKVSSLNLNVCEDENDLNTYFDAIRQYIYKKRINDLTLELKKETNAIRKKEIAKQIVELKIKESGV